MKRLLLGICGAVIIAASTLPALSAPKLSCDERYTYHLQYLKSSYRWLLDFDLRLYIRYLDDWGFSYEEYERLHDAATARSERRWASRDKAFDAICHFAPGPRPTGRVDA